MDSKSVNWKRALSALLDITGHIAIRGGGQHRWLLQEPWPHFQHDPCEFMFLDAADC